MDKKRERTTEDLIILPKYTHMIILD